MRRSLPALALALLAALPVASAATLVDSTLEPHDSPLGGEVVLAGKSVVVPTGPLPSMPAVEARAYDATTPALDQGVTAARGLGGVRAEVDEATLADPSTWDATLDAAVGSLVSLRAEGSGDGLARAGERRLESSGFEIAPRAPHRALARAEPAPRALHALPPLAAATAPPHAPRGTDAPHDARADDELSAQTAALASPSTPAWRAAATLLAGAVLLLLAPFALYHRIRGARALDHEKRALVARLVRERPGIHAGEIAEALGVARKTACYHVDRLVAEGLLVVERSPRRVRYFAPGAVAPAQRSALVVAVESTAVLDAVKRAPGTTVSELARALGVGRSTVRWHLRKLSQAQLVRFAREGRGVRVLPSGEPEAFS